LRLGLTPQKRDLSQLLPFIRFHHRVGFTRLIIHVSAVPLSELPIYSMTRSPAPKNSLRRLQLIGKIPHPGFIEFVRGNEIY
jgi:hypothetical protein